MTRGASQWGARPRPSLLRAFAAPAASRERPESWESGERRAPSSAAGSAGCGQERRTRGRVRSRAARARPRQATPSPGGRRAMYRGRVGPPWGITGRPLARAVRTTRGGPGNAGTPEMRGPRERAGPAKGKSGVRRVNPVCAAPTRGAHARPWHSWTCAPIWRGLATKGWRGYCRSLQRWPKRGREGDHWAEGKVLSEAVRQSSSHLLPTYFTLTGGHPRAGTWRTPARLHCAQHTQSHDTNSHPFARTRSVRLCSVSPRRVLRPL